MDTAVHARSVASKSIVVDDEVDVRDSVVDSVLVVDDDETRTQLHEQSEFCTEIVPIRQLHRLGHVVVVLVLTVVVVCVVCVVAEVMVALVTVLLVLVLVVSVIVELVAVVDVVRTVGRRSHPQKQSTPGITCRSA